MFEGATNWMASIVSQLMDAVSGIFLSVLGTDMSVMEEYFPFLSKAFVIMQYTAWAMLFLITVWQLFRAFGGPITESEHPLYLIGRSTVFAVLIGYAKPIFTLVLGIARAPYTALMDIEMAAEDFTFAGIQNVLMNGITTLVSVISVVGLILMLILLISLGWNYFKLLLEVVERYIVVGVLCYTSPLAFCMGGSKVTEPVFRSWCRMVGSQLLLLVLNVWFLRAFSSSAGQFVGNGGALASGGGNIFLWMFCALAFLKTAQKFDSYLAAMGLNVAQTGSSMAMELLMSARALAGFSGGIKSAGKAFGTGTSSVAGGVATASFANGFVSRFRGNSFVRDAVVDGGVRMGAGGGLGFVGRTFGGMAARNGATLTSDSIATVAMRNPSVSGSIAGDIADRSLGNYMPQLGRFQLSDTKITGGHISTTAVGTDGKPANVELYNATQFEKPQDPHAVVTASDGSQWYQMATGAGRGSFYDVPEFSGALSETARVFETFPGAEEGTVLRTVDTGVLEASTDTGNTRWYNSVYYQEPDAPHTVLADANGVEWYAMAQHGVVPEFEENSEAAAYNQASFRIFMPGYEQPIVHVDANERLDGHFEVRHEDGSGTAFYDTSQYESPRGDYQVYEDSNGHQWYAIHGESAVERRPVYKDGQPVYNNDDGVVSTNVEAVHYKNRPSRFKSIQKRQDTQPHTPKRKS